VSVFDLFSLNSVLSDTVFCDMGFGLGHGMEMDDKKGVTWYNMVDLYTDTHAMTTTTTFCCITTLFVDR
jgi:hypothetical protein